MLDSLSIQKSFFLLGAGASASTIPLTADFASKINQKYLEGGIFDIDVWPRDGVGERILGPLDYHPCSIQEALANRVPPEFIKAYVLQQMVPSSIENCPNYEILNYGSIPKYIFNMNTDGIAKRVCKYHYVLEPHGSVPYDLIRSPEYGRHLEDLLLFTGLDTYKIPGLLLPQPEPNYITSRKEYSVTEEWFPKASYFTVIGYSFGQYKESLDDIETFEFFRYLLRKHSKQIVIVSPNAEFVANIIQESTHIRELHAIPVFWDCLSHAIIEIIKIDKLRNFAQLKSLKKDIVYKYDELSEGKRSFNGAQSS